MSPANEPVSDLESFYSFYVSLAAIPSINYEWDIPRRIIDRMCNRDQYETLKSLYSLPRRYANVSKPEALPEEYCYGMVGNAIAMIRGAAAILFVRGWNEDAYTLTLPKLGSTCGVIWQQELEWMEEIRQRGQLERFMHSHRR